MKRIPFSLEAQSVDKQQTCERKPNGAYSVTKAFDASVSHIENIAKSW